MNVKVYQGLHAMSIRDFKSAAELFLDIVATLTLYELIDYQTFVLIRGSKILEILHGLPLIKDYLYSLYKYRYADFT
ncbi:unnamed protein product [Adineta steineri]|uniref:26S proteasome regulatory subunit Rpn7 N-terminal domain-containing protein n=1 Tax=Adineta steineri TaxID=433720 RepID=A0A813XZV8_9BILA|nr:unnamed protein product [Adineta steineri]